MKRGEVVAKKTMAFCDHEQMSRKSVDIKKILHWPEVLRGYEQWDDMISMFMIWEYMY